MRSSLGVKLNKRPAATRGLIDNTFLSITRKVSAFEKRFFFFRKCIHFNYNNYNIVVVLLVGRKMWERCGGVRRYYLRARHTGRALPF